MYRVRLLQRLSVFSLLVLFATNARLSRADVFELKDGGRIEGQLIEGASANKVTYTIDLATGGRVTIPRSQVAKVDSKSAADAEYQKLARSSPDTVEAHWKMAQWCREQKLRDEFQKHLTRILEIDPDHEAARTALGFRKKDGQWMNRDDVMAARGLVWYDGHYVAPQHVELLERQKESKVTQADWANNIDRLRRQLTGRRHDNSAKARAEIQSIRDPAAADAIVGALRREQDLEVKRLWMEVAARLDSRTAIDALVEISLHDPDPDFRRDSLEYLVNSGRPGLATPYIRALKSPDNEIINRAGEALGEIGNRDAIGPLIDALVTKHTVKISDANPDQHAYTFSQSGGSAFSFGGSGPKTQTIAARNPAVLSALVKLAGNANYQYDQTQWRGWLAAQAKLNAVDLRRDQ
jgi:hypothetical protein